MTEKTDFNPLLHLDGRIDYAGVTGGVSIAAALNCTSCRAVERNIQIPFLQNQCRRSLNDLTATHCFNRVIRVNRTFGIQIIGA